MISAMKEYRLWVENVTFPDLKKELLAIEAHPESIIERFGKALEFGTGGMRGLIGVGQNRMNIYTIRKATSGLACFLNKNYSGDKRVAIAYDSRRMSREFALETSLVLAGHGIQAFLFNKIIPTPILSFAVRELGCCSGVVITASHNPKDYNGYKVYDHNGGQVTEEIADKITAEIENIESFFAISPPAVEVAHSKGMLHYLNDDLMYSYLDKTISLLQNRALVDACASSLRIVYSPLHGAGLVPICELFKKAGFSSVNLVEKQITADPDFPTVVCPNPEEIAACELAIVDAQKYSADIVLITDPDADRIGLVVPDDRGNYVQLNGNQTGALLIDYLLQMLKTKNALPENGVIVKTIVTSDMGAFIAKSYDVGCVEVLTGFKYIGAKIAEFEQNKTHDFLFGYEESYGYLFGTHVRDKDAIQTALLLCEMALFHQARKQSVYQRLQELYKYYGFFMENLINVSLPGTEGSKIITLIMNGLRNKPFDRIEDLPVLSYKDYLSRREYDLQAGVSKTIDLPFSDVLYYQLAKDSWFCIRPSGTEPKLKIYIGTRDDQSAIAGARLARLTRALENMINSYIS